MGLDIRELALETLSISPQNVRKDLGDLTELIDSITEVGVLEPIVVRPMGEGYEVIAGYHRTEAARRAGLTTIPASVLELTDVQAILTSLIENLQRQDMSVVERVEAYKELQVLEPAYSNKAALAKVVGRTPQKIGQDLQAYEIAVVLEPYGIRVESHFRRTSPERQRGDVLPEYHAVLLHQASSWLRAKDVIPDDIFIDLQVEWARRIAPHSQEKAEEIIAQLKSATDSIDKLLSQVTPARRHTSRARKVAATTVEEAGFITCACCDRMLQLIHAGDGTHTVVDTPFTGQPLLPAPAFPLEPVPAALNPASVASDAGTSQHI
jgi:ParB/RepB/Spo0J family partition protein